MTADHVKIVPLGSADLDSISALYHATWHETQAPYQDQRIVDARDTAFFKSRLQRWQNSTLVALCDSQPAGLASWHGPVLEALYITPQFRSSGLGTKLLVATESEMRRCGESELSLDCLCANISGRRFYENNGWRVLKTAAVPDGIHRDIITEHWAMVK